jgi:hypothetical protein
LIPLLFCRDGKFHPRGEEPQSGAERLGDGRKALAIWAAGGERAEDLDQFRQDKALALLLGHEFAVRADRARLPRAIPCCGPALLQEGKSGVPAESAPLLGLAKANAKLVLDLQCRRPVKTPTLDIDATVIACDKRTTKRAGACPRAAGGRQSRLSAGLAPWAAEQDVIIANVFRDGNVPGGSGNPSGSRQGAGRAAPGGLDKIYLRGDSALYEHELMRWLDAKAIGYAISADMSPQLCECIAAMPGDH